MSFTSEYMKLRKKRIEEEVAQKTGHSFTDEYNKLSAESKAERFDTEDIAPVAPKKENTKVDGSERTWFQKGAFEDGYQFGDILKTISATGHDLDENISAGLLGMGEKIVDAGAYLVGGAAGLFGADDFKDATGRFIAKDLYDEEAIAKKFNLGTTASGVAGLISNLVTKKLLGVDTEADSVLGEKTDALAQSGGQLLGTIGLQAVGVPWFVTSGVTSFGSEAEAALNEGATYGQAGLSAAISAGAEILTEKLFGGSGLGEKGLINLEPLTKGISNKVVKVLADLGVDMMAEGSEEVVSSVFGRLGSALYKEESLSELLFSEEAVDEYIESFIGGAALGGIMNTGKAASSIKTGTDYRTGLTENEQKVFDKVYEDRVAEEEKSGTKLTKKEKAAIYDSVSEDLERGRISIDTIEEVLGGEAYKSYKGAVDSEEAILKEYEELGKKENPTLADQARYAELSQQIKEIKENSTRDALKKKLSDDVFGLAKGSRLVESYNERVRRSQAFTDDPTRFTNENARQTVQNAIDSGLMHDGGDAHDFVNLAAKVSEDKGYVVEFVTSKKLAEMKASGEVDIQADPNRINAFVNKKTKKMYVNMDTGKSLPSLVGHEITHTLESSGYYKELQEAITAYAKTKGEYFSRGDKAFRLYGDIEGADKSYFTAEMTADLVGDYLFTDSEFISHLSSTNRNLFQRIFDEIKYFIKIATAGSKEARQLEKVKRAFEKAYRDGAKVDAQVDAKGGKKYSLGYHAGDLGKAEGYWNMASSNRGTGHFGTGTYFVGDEAEISDSYYGKRPHEKVEFDNYNLFKPLYEDEGFELHNALRYINNNISLYPIASMSFEEAYDVREAVGKAEDVLYFDDNSTDAEKAEAQKVIDEYKKRFESIGYDPEQWDADRLYEEIKEIRSDYRNATMKFTSIFLGKKGLGYDATAKEIEAAIKSVYDEVSRITDAYAARYEDSSSTRFMKALGYEGVDVRGFKGLDNTKYGSVIYDLKGEDAKRKAEIGTAKYSLSDSETSSDSDGRQLTREQSEYFRDSKMRDDDGNLMVMYHGSRDAGFHVFDASFSDDDTSFFFTDRNDVAATYSGTSETYTAPTLRTAEDFYNLFYEIEAEDVYEVKEENGKFVLYDRGEAVAESDTAKGLYDEWVDYTGLGEGSGNYKVYLNLTNPLIVDAQGRNWNRIPSGFSQEVYDKIDSLTPEEREALAQLAAWEDGGIFRDELLGSLGRVVRGAEVDDYTRTLASAAEKVGDTDLYRLFDMAADNFDEESIRENSVSYLKTRDFAKQAREGGHDGVIFKNLVDVGGYGTGKEGASTVAIAFSSEQIKSVANETPTSEPDIRFSLSEPVEETGELMALHNLKSNELLKSLDLGGLPMPSIAIIRAEAGHEQYGDISLILPKESIDPQASRDNKVYGGDAWTPTYPRMEYKASDTVSKRISDKYYEMAAKYGYDKVRALYDYVYELEHVLNRSGGETALKEELYDDTRLMQVYLLDSGKGEVPKVTKEIRTELTDHEVSMYEFLAQKLGNEVIDGVSQVGLGSPAEQRKAYWANYGEAIKEAYGEFLSKEFGFSEEAIQSVFSNMNTASFLKVVRDAKKYKTSGRVTIKTEDDYAATQEAIRKAAGEDYKAWIDDLFGGSEEKSGIRNNVDLFTRSGNRRNWEALHWENTLENVVKAMRQQDRTGSEAVFGVHKFFAASSKDYGSIAEIKSDSNRLRKISDGDYQAAKDAFERRFSDIATRIMDKSESNQFIAMDNAMECIVEAVRASKTKTGISRVLSQYSHLNVTEADIDDIVSLVTDISNMPTGYFEAKPMRAVSFDEVGVFVIPYNADVRLKQELLNRGYSIAEYDPNVEGDRQRVVNQFEEYKFSLSDTSETYKEYGDFNIYAKDIRLEQTPEQDVAPVGETVEAEGTEEEAYAPTELPSDRYSYEIYEELQQLSEQIMQAAEANDAETVNKLLPRCVELEEQYREAMAAEEAENQERIDTLDDAEAPPEVDAPYYGESEEIAPDDPFVERDIKAVGNRKVKAYMYENPEVKPFFQEEANIMLGELRDTTKGERFYTAIERPDRYGAESYGTWTGVSRQTTDDIAYLLDELGYTYAEIEKGLKAIIEDNGKENNACSKRIEFLLNSRLMNGHQDMFGNDIPANQDYIRLLNEKQITEYNDTAFDSYMESVGGFAPVTEDVAPVPEKAYEAIRPRTEKEPRLIRVKEGATDAPPYETRKASQVKGQTTMFAEDRIAKVMDIEPQISRENANAWAKFKANFLDKGAVFEDLSIKTKNRELIARWNYTLSSKQRAQYMIGNGAKGVKSLNAIRESVERTGKAKLFYEYMYHRHNVDRMNLEERYEDMQNKPVFGYDVTSEQSRAAAEQIERENPQFKAFADDVYAYMSHLRKQMVDSGVISQETADLWAEMYPHYVPVRRLGDSGLNINVPLDTGRTGVNAPVKKATGGNRDILPLFDTMALRTEQTFSAIAKNNFGVELMETLGTTIESADTSLDEVIDSVDTQDGLLQEGKNGKNPTFTVFKNGEKVTFEITEEMYNALKPMSKGLAYTNKIANKVSNLHRGVLTEYNPVFMLTNAIKDVQDILINSQHPAKTYAALPKAFRELATKGKWYTEYMANGGESNTYFDGRSNTFTADDTGIKKIIGMPLRKISQANDFIERAPRLAEYIASREAGASAEVAMLDAARVTTNFAAGGDVTKFLNRNGATFLNASVQGALQQVRNVREAKMNGLKGWAQLAGKFAIGGLAVSILNNLIWDDDEEYEELSDYVKQNYYIVAKYGDGQFVRIPKGRTLAILQNAFDQVINAATGDDEVDLKSFLDLVVTNLAPNNPVEDNILAPISQALTNKTWYGEDLVPTRLQDLPAAEQYDESTDAISKWLGEKLNISPMKINYILNQYSGGVGDVFLPMMTPEAERGDDSLLGNMIAPLKDKFTTDSTMNNQNVSDFYTTKDELAKNAKSMNATDEDVLKYKYFNSKNSELSDLYAEKREIQNSDLPNDEKYEAVREIQEQIVALAKESLEAYNNVHINDGYAVVGDIHYRLSDGEWKKLTDKQYQQQEDVTDELGIDPSTYWQNKSEYDFAYEYPEKYAVAKSVGGFESYKQYSSEMYDIRADKDENGKTIVGSRKEKIANYINDLDIDYGERLILFKSEYKADDTYNYEIIDYLHSREDISYEDMEAILKELGFTVSSDGTITWD